MADLVVPVRADVFGLSRVLVPYLALLFLPLGLLALGLRGGDRRRLGLVAVTGVVLAALRCLPALPAGAMADDPALPQVRVATWNLYLDAAPARTMPPLIAATIKAPEGPTLDVIVAHAPPPRVGLGPLGPSTDPRRRDASLQALRQRLKVGLEAGCRVVLLGDLNVTDREVGYMGLAVGLTDSYHAAGSGLGHTRRPPLGEGLPFGMLRIDMSSESVANEVGDLTGDLDRSAAFCGYARTALPSTTPSPSLRTPCRFRALRGSGMWARFRVLQGRLHTGVVPDHGTRPGWPQTPSAQTPPPKATGGHASKGARR